MTTTFERPFSDLDLVERGEWAADQLIPALSSRLAARDVPASVESTLWAIEDLAAVFPGVGLTWHVCDGECDRLIAFVPDDGEDRLILCDSCRDEASHATEEYLHALVRHRQADDGPGDYRPARLADVLSDSLKARIQLIEDAALHPDEVRVIDTARLESLSLDAHPNAFGIADLEAVADQIERGEE